MKKIITKADQFLVKNYKTILFVYIIFLINFLWWQLYLSGEYGYYGYEIFEDKSDDLILGDQLVTFLLAALPLTGLIAWKKIFHPND